MIEASLPKHQKIAAHLRNEIENEEFIPGDKLPSEKRLCEYFKVSRVTVRDALKVLEKEGLIYKKQGLGAFVKEDSHKPTLVQLTDFNEDMRRAGFSSSSKLISFRKVQADPEINPILGIPPEKPLIRIERIRKANKNPIALDITWLPASYGQLLLDEDLTNKTIYQVLEEEYSIPITAGKYSFTATVADERIAKYLNVDVGSPLFQINRCSRTIGDKKIYFQKRYNNPKYVHYEIELSRIDEKNESSKEGLPLKEFVPKFKF
ncbi:MAG: GntR family transcriptional regulator [Balneolales bacterium]|nr:GntR family transcriptional regulator [Balneolales bacterium]